MELLSESTCSHSTSLDWRSSHRDHSKFVATHFLFFCYVYSWAAQIKPNQTFDFFRGHRNLELLFISTRASLDFYIFLFCREWTAGHCGQTCRYFGEHGFWDIEDKDGRFYTFATDYILKQCRRLHMVASFKKIDEIYPSLSNSFKNCIFQKTDQVRRTRKETKQWLK